MSRPSIYTEKMAEDICRRISLGESARQICRDETMPVLSTVMLWLTQADKVFFSDQYDKARQWQADYYADEIVDIADELCVDADSNSIQRAKLQIDSRKWKVSRMSPRRWGDKQGIDHTSSDESFKPTVITLVAEPFPESDDA